MVTKRRSVLQVNVICKIETIYGKVFKKLKTSFKQNVGNLF